MLLEKLKFNATPGETSPKECLLFYQTKLLKSLSIHFQKIAETTKIKLDTQLELLSQIDPQRRISPFLFSLYAQIKESYEKKDVESLLDEVQSFNVYPPEKYYSDDREYGAILSEHWEKTFILELRNSTPHDAEGEFLTQKVQMFPLIHWKQDDFPPIELKQSEEILAHLDRDLFHEYQTYVSCVKLYSSKSLISATSPRCFGAIFHRVAHSHESPVLFYLENLVHELSHLHLFAMMGEDRMVLNGDNELFDSPLRPDKRPMLGIFHATFVLARIIRILRKEGSSASLPRKEKSFRDGLKTIAQHARLTENGQSLVNSLEGCAFD